MEAHYLFTPPSTIERIDPDGTRRELAPVEGAPFEADEFRWGYGGGGRIKAAS